MDKAYQEMQRGESRSHFIVSNRIVFRGKKLQKVIQRLCKVVKGLVSSKDRIISNVYIPDKIALKFIKQNL